jgi:hypothetical protein
MEAIKPQKEQHSCPHCGASMQAYKHTLSSGLVSSLIKAIQFVHRVNKNEFHLQHDLTSLTKNEYNNFQKLRFHGLVAKVDSKAGYWLITKRGGQFLRGEIAVPMHVVTFRNKVIERAEELIHIDEYRGEVPEFQKEFAYESQRFVQKTRTLKTLWN